MLLSQISLALFLATTATAGMAHSMPHADLVSNYLQKAKNKEALANCRTRPMVAPAANTGIELECWAANAANDLQKEPATVSKLVLDATALEAVLTHCKALSMERMFKSAECVAAGRADTFISLRLPRSVGTLKPVTFK